MKKIDRSSGGSRASSRSHASGRSRADSRTNLRGPALVLAASLAAVGVVSGLCACRTAAGGRIRVVLITLDTLRYDAFAGSAGRPTAMPATLAEAERGAVFQRFYAATSTTEPSHASIFTGLPPWQHGVTRNGITLDDRFETVTEILKHDGFSTFAAVASFPVSRVLGFGQGFDEFSDTFTRSAEGGDAEGAGLDPGRRFYSLADQIVERAIRALDSSSARKQFFWFHFFDPHSPYGDTGGGESMTGEAISRKARGQGGHVEAELVRAHELYDRDVGYLDRQLSRLFARLRSDAGAIETHLVVAADHGECFGEGGTIGHGRRLADETLRVPLFIVSPKVAPGARPDTAGSVDLAPTILSLAGIPRELPGARDLTRPPAGPTHAFGMRRTWAAAAEEVHLDDGTVSWISGHLFYAVGDDGALHIGDAAKVETAADGAQLDPASSARLAQLFRSFENRLSAPGEPAIDPEVEQSLRALGYVN